MKVMKSLTQLHMLGIISLNIGDNAYEQYEDFIKSNFDSISYKDGDHSDDLFFQTLKMEQFPKLAQISIIIFVISHGQADVEKDFLINTNVIDVNMKEQFIWSKCLVRDHMQKHNLQPATIEITNVLKKIMLCCLPTIQNLSRRRKQGSKKKKLTNQNRFWIRKLRKLKVRLTI